VSQDLVLTNARIVLDDAIIAGTVHVREGLIAGIDPGTTNVPGAIDLEGDYLLPGLVDVHTDHLEKHVFPRAHVRWDMMRAVMALDHLAGTPATIV
jgi:alpha-D-ribose 1-methylphosphonate 5-triphosphate diphosphatase